MRICSIRCYHQEQPFRDGPYVVSGGRSSLGFDSLIVAIESSEGLTGWGEMSPLGATYDPAFPEGARAAAPLLAEALMGQNPAEVGKLANLMDRTLKGHAYAKSAFDMALWDLAGKRAGLPLAELLGGRFGKSVELYRSLSQAEPKAMAERAKKYQAEGYRRLQVKVGGNPEEDAARLFAVAEALPPGFVLYCDANGGWRRGDALSFLRLTRNASYVMEQPCQSYEDNLALRPFCDRPLVLDENIVDQASLLRAAADGMVDGITIKIARVGGITRAHHLREIAVGLHLAVTVEDTGGAEIDTAAMAHLSLSTPEACRAHTVDFHNWVTVSNADGLPACHDGRMQAPLGPGLGLAVKSDRFGRPIHELTA